MCIRDSYYPGDVWDLYEQKAKATEVLPIGVVLTMAATASEANGVSVIWNEEQNRKCALTDARVCPKFALMNPELTYTVPARQTAAGSLDIFAHAFERYIVRSQEGVLRDHLCESIMPVSYTHLMCIRDSLGIVSWKACETIMSAERKHRIGWGSCCSRWNFLQSLQTVIQIRSAADSVSAQQWPEHWQLIRKS